MSDDLEISKRGVEISWGWILNRLMQWGWAVVLALLAGHVAFTKQSQAQQDQKIERLERAIKACVEKSSSGPERR